MAETTVSVGDGIDICYETFGDRSDPTMLLVMGLAGPMGWWSVELCEALAARGYHVIRYDNRDTGASTKQRERRVNRSDIIRAFLGDHNRAVYTMSDLAGDAFGLLDALDIDRFHLVGASMGGMIAQTMAIERPERVRSLTSIMSTTGRRTVGWQHPKLLPALLARTGPTRGAYVERTIRTQQLIGSPTFPPDLAELRSRAEETYDRGWSASGVLRQMLAILCQPDRTAELEGLDIATCVVHGLEDPLVHPSGGRATAQAIPNAELILIPGLGHDLPRQLTPTFVDAIDRTARRTGQARSCPVGPVDQ
ncbi:alpha/beta fold hydrolase [Solicola gregarius]|uniref:Alpha/beta fold hydrolase n=1 Tax=Solicola gregarius TaxID=2908642 RepID=A0AA46YM76_9ACTN|nr:alpha/beta hydrolase [Solicola gregarius]UYM06251.1 alpha/beta fold hydrolase [Solicola gregarius]